MRGRRLDVGVVRSTERAKPQKPLRGIRCKRILRAAATGTVRDLLRSLAVSEFETIGAVRESGNRHETTGRSTPTPRRTPASSGF